MAMVNGKDKKKILIVDDSPEAIAVLANALSDNYKRKVALNGEQAFKLLFSTEELPDLILMDVMMPEMDGYEVCRHLKSNEKFKDIPVIFLSSLSEVNDKIKAFENGGVDYIQKPFEIAEVNARIETHLRIRELQFQIEKHNKFLNQMVKEKVKEISESQTATIFALARLSESRDNETGEHLLRIKVLCRTLAEKLKENYLYKNLINDEFIENLELASPLHDIGKVGIKDAILLKKGKLTDLEFEEIKQHTLIGAETLREVYQKYPNNIFIKIGIEIANFHHEKWDGTGYPEGLAGDAIPLSARIMAIADEYDALRSKRVYKEAFSHEKSLEIIKESSGSHFDPEIAKVFLENESDFCSIYGKINL